MRKERDVIVALGLFAVFRVGEQEFFDDLIALDGLFDNRLDVAGLDFGVEDAFRFNYDQGTLLAETVATGFLNGLDCEALYFLFVQAFLEGVSDFLGAVGDTSGAEAYHHFLGLFVQVTLIFLLGLQQLL